MIGLQRVFIHIGFEAYSKFYENHTQRIQIPPWNRLEGFQYLEQDGKV